MRIIILSAFIITAVMHGLPAESFAATVSCEVKEISGSTLTLNNCDERMLKDFQVGNKVKVRQQKKEN